MTNKKRKKWFFSDNFFWFLNIGFPVLSDFAVKKIWGSFRNFQVDPAMSLEMTTKVKFKFLLKMIVCRNKYTSMYPSWYSIRMQSFNHIHTWLIHGYVYLQECPILLQYLRFMYILKTYWISFISSSAGTCGSEVYWFCIIWNILQNKMIVQLLDNQIRIGKLFGILGN